MGKREVISGVKEPETTIKAALARWERQIESALRVELEGGWDAYVLVSQPAANTPGHVIGLVILPRGDEPNPKGLLTDDLRQPFLAGAPSEIAIERFTKAYRAGRRTQIRTMENRVPSREEVEPSEQWMESLRTGIANLAKADRPRPRQRASDDFYAYVASIYVQKCQEDRRRVLRLTYEHLHRHGIDGKPWRRLTYGMVRDHVRTARDRGYLLRPGQRGVVACQVTDKLAEWLAAQGKGKKQ